SSPGLVETSAGRLSRRLSLCARYTGPVQVFPSKEATCSDHTAPIWFHQMGCALRTASHSLPDASTFRRGILFFGAGLGWGVALGRRALVASGLGAVHSAEAPCRFSESTRRSGTPGNGSPRP